MAGVLEIAVFSCLYVDVNRFTYYCAFYEGNLPVAGGFTLKGLIMRGFSIFVVVNMNKLLNENQTVGDFGRYYAQVTSL